VASDRRLNPSLHRYITKNTKKGGFRFVTPGKSIKKNKKKKGIWQDTSLMGKGNDVNISCTQRKIQLRKKSAQLGREEV